MRHLILDEVSAVSGAGPEDVEITYYLKMDELEEDKCMYSVLFEFVGTKDDIAASLASVFVA